MSRRPIGIVLLVSLLSLSQQALALDLVSVDTVQRTELLDQIHAGYTDQLTWEDAYTSYVDVHGYVPNVTADFAWNYVQDIYNLQEWTISVRNVQPMSDWQGRTRYAATEAMPPGGYDYFLERKDPESRTIDWWVGKAPEDIWMRYSIRIVDAQEVLGKPGIVITWVNFGHEKFLLDPMLHQGFLMMKIAHGIERDNLGKILQWRAAGNTAPLTPAVAAELGLINVELYEPMSIWFMVGSRLRPTVSWSEHYGDFIGNHFFLPGVAVPAAWSFVTNPFNMEDWTVSLRNIQGNETEFTGEERLRPHGRLRGKIVRYAGAKTIDLLVAPEAEPAPIMNSTLRVLDGAETNGMSGTVVVWITYRHDGLDQPRFGDYWKYLPAQNKIDAQNIGALIGAPAVRGAVVPMPAF
ncbi:MAG TPA: hypothetical protein VGQ83_15660 [Polyangia bacterium]|jgi:hypothetical protein